MKSTVSGTMSLNIECAGKQILLENIVRIFTDIL